MSHTYPSRCPITYEALTSDKLYSQKGLNKLSRKLKNLLPLPWTAEEQRKEAILHSDKMSIQGVQPKLSAKLNITKGCFTIVDRNGQYILKPPSEFYTELPQNEDLSMRLAASVGIETPLHGLLFNKDDSLTYFIKRFDRGTKQRKFACEDFSQLSNHTRNTKYNSSMEHIIDTIEQYCTFPEIQKRELFIRVLFNYLIGNEDMHLKNFSLITIEEEVKLSPAYDFLNSTIALGTKAREEFALPLNGKKNNIRRTDLLNYYAKERLELNQKVIEKILEKFKAQFDTWEELISDSFLSTEMKDLYLTLLEKRKNIIF